MAAASTAARSSLLSIEQYLNTDYRPDVGYVDGYIDERNLGEFDRGDPQLEIAASLRNRQQEWSIRVVSETRMRVSETRVRIPDVCILEAGREREQVITSRASLRYQLSEVYAGFGEHLLPNHLAKERNPRLYE